MVKASTRFRNRKINFKSRLAVRIGYNDADEENDDAAEIEFEEDKSKQGHVETGVDKEEESEYHLQAVIASSAASVAHRGGRKASGPVEKAKAAAAASIPTPDAAGTVDRELYNSLYPPNTFREPHGYIRFSDTVEEAQRGAVRYTMDDDDEEWLEDYNLSVGAKPDGTAAPNGEEVATKRSKSKSNATGPITEDEFELVFEVFEVTTEDKAPMAHVSPSSLPSQADMEAAFDAPSMKPTTAILKPFVKTLYPYWKERRLRREGKIIFPQLDHDETNDNNPYVCFRRRELKTGRKTRRSDAQNIDRLVKLRNDVFAAHALMMRVRDRERLKLQALQAERTVFEGRAEMRELKRRLGEADGDEELLIGRREKKRRRDELAQSNLGAPGSLRLSLRKPDGTTEVFSPMSLIPSVESQRALKERANTINQRVERDMQRKREQDKEWEDWTDGAWYPPLLSPPNRFWRTAEPVSATMPFGPNQETREAIAFGPMYQFAVGRPRASIRLRLGRNGRPMLDRIAPDRLKRIVPPRKRLNHLIDDSDSDAEEEESEQARARREERWRYDNDATDAFPTADGPTLIDDFEYERLVRRASLVRPADVESVSLDSAYLEEAAAWAAREPERFPPPQVVGRPPPPPVHQPRSAVPLAAAHGQAGGNPAALAQMQQMMVAQRAAQLQQQQQAQQQQAAAAAAAAVAAGQQQHRVGTPGSQASELKRSPSANNMGSPATPHSLPLAMNGLPLQASWTSGAPTPGSMKAVSEQGGLFPPQQQPYAPTNLSNGVHLAQRVAAAQGALAAAAAAVSSGPGQSNGLAMSSPQVSNGMPLPLAATNGMQSPALTPTSSASGAPRYPYPQQGQPQQGGTAMSPNGVHMLHRMPSSGDLNGVGLVRAPSRPGSAASMHHPHHPSSSPGPPNLRASAVAAGLANKQNGNGGTPQPQQRAPSPMMLGNMVSMAKLGALQQQQQQATSGMHHSASPYGHLPSPHHQLTSLPGTPVSGAPFMTAQQQQS